MCQNNSICPKCGNTFDPGKYNKKYCTRKCSNSRIHSNETKNKISCGVKLNYEKMTPLQRETLLNKQRESFEKRRKPKKHCVGCGKVISKLNEK